MESDNTQRLRFIKNEWSCGQGKLTHNRRPAGLCGSANQFPNPKNPSYFNFIRS